MLNEFEKRYGDQNLRRFCNIWPYASMLHDVGYILEGNLEPLSAANEEAHIRMGALHVEEYFKHRLWAVCNLGAACDREAIRQMTNVEGLAFNDFSLSGIADALRKLDDVDGLREEV